jgi:predicted amidohydrolase
MIALAAANGAGYIFFPELSLTGYEPSLAASFATTAEDSRFDEFQTMSNSNRITIGVGMPLKNIPGIQIGMLLFQPGQARKTYSKQYLHPDEYPYFISGNQPVLLADNQLAIAICYELSVAAHIEQAIKAGAKIYVASVAKSVTGAEKAVEQLAAIAKGYSLPVLMSNCIGHCDDFDCGGKTAAWNNKGEMIGQLNDTLEGILIMDTITEEIVKKEL